MEVFSSPESLAKDGQADRQKTNPLLHPHTGEG